MPTLPVKPNTVPSGAKPPGVKTPGSKVHAMPPLPEFPDRSPGWEVVAMAVIALALMTACWFVPRPTGDLYVALAGARDVIDGKLGNPSAPLVKALGAFGVRTGGPDDWSFDEPRPVWMNQNWGTHLLFYFAWTVFGPNGVPGLKGVLMLTMAASIVLACRQHKVRWSVSLLMGGCAVIGGWAYIDLRPNIILLTLAPMMYWLLIRSRHNPHRIWWSVVLMAFWGNMHGSFIFGLGMMGLWAACAGLSAGFSEGWEKAFRRWWPVAAAPVVGLLVTTVLSPFGWENLTHPLIMFSGDTGEAWRGVAEWNPVLPAHRVDYGSTTEFFVAMGLLALLAAVRPLANLLGGKRKLGLADAVLVAFSLIVSLCATVASLKAFTAASKLLGTLEWSGDPEGMIPEQTELRSGALFPLVGFLLIAALGAYAVFRVFASLVRAQDSRREDYRPPAEKQDASLLFFAVMLAGIVLYMAFTSRRFVTLSLGLVAPLLGAQLDWLFRQARRVPLFRFARPVVLAGAAVLPFAWCLLARSLPTYDARNPFFPPGLSTVFDRMTDNNAYIHGGADFLNLNHVAGNAVQEWRWEGFLHWKCPQMKIYVGGRAQQAYGEGPYKRRMRLWGAQYSVAPGPTAQAQRRMRLQDELRDLKVNYVIAPLDMSSTAIISTLLSPDSPWTMVYYDRDNVILGNSENPQVKALIDRIISGQAEYPRDVPGVGAATRAMCMAFLPRQYSAQDRLLALEQANREMPSAEFLNRIIQIYEAGGVGNQDSLVQYLSGCFQETAKIHKNPYEDFKVLVMRMELTRMLASLTGKDPQAAAEWKRAAVELQGQYGEAFRWR